MVLLQAAAAARKGAERAGAPDRMIVVSRSHGDLTWLSRFLGSTPTTVMQLVNMTAHRVGCWEGAVPHPQQPHTCSLINCM